MENQYLNKTWWMNWLKNIFPENHGTYNPAWGAKSSAQTSHFISPEPHWYKSGIFIFGITYASATSKWPTEKEPGPPFVTIRVLGRPDLGLDFLLKLTEDEISFIEALANPDLLPLCVNINWAQPIIEYYFKEGIKQKFNF